MNPIVKIISQFIAGINRLIDDMDERSQDTIRQTFYTITALLLAGAALTGYFLGTKSAKRTGTQLIGSTNDAFRIDLKKEHPQGDFRSMLDTELISEIRESGINKVEFPANERFEPQRREGIIEPDTSERKITPAPGLDLRDRISEADRTDDTAAVPEVKNLRRRELDSRVSEEPGIIKDEPAEGIRRGPAEKPAAKKDTVRDKKARGAREPVLKPIEKKTGIIEK